MAWHQFNFWMPQREHPEDLVGKRLPDGRHASKIQHHNREQLDSGKQSLCL